MSVITKKSIIHTPFNKKSRWINQIKSVYFAVGPTATHHRKYGKERSSVEHESNNNIYGAVSYKRDWYMDLWFGPEMRTPQNLIIWKLCLLCQTAARRRQMDFPKVRFSSLRRPFSSCGPDGNVCVCEMDFGAPHLEITHLNAAA